VVLVFLRFGLGVAEVGLRRHLLQGAAQEVVEVLGVVCLALGAFWEDYRAGCI
jgi:hypothetical protein